ncbi:MAG: HesA/MoeB/ThiF family protein [Phycisphaerae bacterium]
MTEPLPHLSPEELQRYAWQLDIPGFGPEAQQRLKASSVLISRVGGIGGAVALSLAAAGVGRVVLAHAGNIELSDLHRQTLMTTAGLGSSRVLSAHRRLRDLNPQVAVEVVAENITSENADRLIPQVDIVVSAAPRFTERLTLNEYALRHGKPLIDCACYELQAQILTVVPAQSACLACLYPELPDAWNRRFPILGAVSSMIGAWGALEVIKLLAPLGKPLTNTLLLLDLGANEIRRVPLTPRAGCRICRLGQREGINQFMSQRSVE